VSGQKTSPMSRQSHRPSLAAWVAATYSASAVESMTSSCLHEAQLTAPPLSRYV